MYPPKTNRLWRLGARALAGLAPRRRCASASGLSSRTYGPISSTASVVSINGHPPHHRVLLFYRTAVHAREAACGLKSLFSSTVFSAGGHELIRLAFLSPLFRVAHRCANRVYLRNRPNALWMPDRLLVLDVAARAGGLQERGKATRRKSGRSSSPNTGYRRQHHCGADVCGTTNGQCNARATREPFPLCARDCTQPGWYKVLAGVGSVALCVGVLWVPLLMFSSVSPLNTPNPITGAWLTIGLARSSYPCGECDRTGGRGRGGSQGVRNDPAW